MEQPLAAGYRRLAESNTGVTGFQPNIRAPLEAQQLARQGRERPVGQRIPPLRGVRGELDFDLVELRP